MTGQNIGHHIRKHAQTNIGRHEPAYKQLDAKMNRDKVYGKYMTNKQYRRLKVVFLEFQRHVLPRKHMNNQFTRAKQASRETIGNHQEPISDDGGDIVR